MCREFFPEYSVAIEPLAAVFSSEMAKVREIRNDMIHFDLKDCESACKTDPIMWVMSVIGGAILGHGSGGIALPRAA